MQMVTLQVPAGMTTVNVDGNVYVASGGLVTVPQIYEAALLNAGCVQQGAGLPVDQSGNLIANIVPRSGTLAALLAISNAGNGEIASATDFDALVKFLNPSGNLSTGKSYWRSREITDVWNACGTGCFTSTSSTTYTVMPLFPDDTISDDPFNVIDPTTAGVINVPAGAGFFDINGYFAFSASAVGTSRSVWLFGSVDGTSFAALATLNFQNPNGTQKVGAPFSFKGSVGSFVKFTIKVNDDSGAGLSVLGADLSGVTANVRARFLAA